MNGKEDVHCRQLHIESIDIDLFLLIFVTFSHGNNLLRDILTLVRKKKENEDIKYLELVIIQFVFSSYLIDFGYFYMYLIKKNSFLILKQYPFK